ncbi:MAG: right-handed parallel beta-helix repeat-containing protein [Dehalococcoidia bacterium]
MNKTKRYTSPIRRCERSAAILVALALVLSLGLVMGTPVAAANGPPVASGLVLHLDADAITGLSDGDPVATWPDLSGEGNDATQGTPADQPEWVEDALAGKPVVRFDGSDYLVEDSGSYTTPLTIFAVGLNTAGAGDSNQHSRLIQLSATSDFHGFFGSRSDDFATFFGNGSAWSDIAANTPGESVLTARLLAVVNDGATAAPYVDGVAQDTKTGTMAAATGLIIGSGMNGAQARSQYWGGDIAEILIYDRTLTTQERVDMEWYLGEKWLGWERPAQVWVCDTHGDDGNPGTFDDPFKTIQHGITVVAVDGTVNVKAGTYTENVTITRSLTLRSTDGADDTTITGLVTIDLDDGQTVVFGGEEGAGFTVDRGNPIPDSGILLSVDNGSEVTVSHNIITGEDAGIRSEAATIEGGSTVTIEHNVITNNPGHGVHLHYISESTVNVERNQITDNGGHGIYIWRIDDGPKTVTIAGNTITGNTDSGIHVTTVSASTLVIEDNRIQDNGQRGIYIQYVQQSSIVEMAGNTIGGDEEDEGNEGPGIYIDEILDSTVTIGGDTEAAANTISRNCRVSNATGVHVGSIRDSDVTIEYNTMTDNNGAGIYIGYIGHAPRTVTIARNIITGNAGAGIYAGHVIDSTLIIEYNTITDNLGTGIHISSISLAPCTVTITHNTVTGHLHHEGQDRDGIYVGHVYESTLNILGNVINENRYGIGLNDIYGSALDISFNNIFENDPYGVLVNSSDEPVDATHNWWGHASGPTHATNPDGTGDEVSDNVDFTPWLGAAMTNQPTGCTADRGYGEDASAQTDNVSANVTGGDDTTAVTVAEYVGNPTGVSSGLAAGTLYLDVHVSGTLPTQLVVEVDCPDGDCSGIVLRWFNGDDWHDVEPVSYTNGTIEATLSDTSSPTIAELTGTPFALGNLIPPVGGTAYPVNRMALLALWVGLAAIIAGATICVRRRRAQS